MLYDMMCAERCVCRMVCVVMHVCCCCWLSLLSLCAMYKDMYLRVVCVRHGMILKY